MIDRFISQSARFSFAVVSRQRLLLIALGAGFGLLAGLSFWRFGFGLSALTTTICAWMLLVFAVIDLEKRLVPDRLLLVALPIVLVLNLLVQQPAILSSLLGGLFGLALFGLIHTIRPQGMGLGDVKLAGLIGLMVGFPDVVFALLLGIIAGGIAALFLILQGKDRQQTMAYAPFLAIGGWTALYLF